MHYHGALAPVAPPKHRPCTIMVLWLLWLLHRPRTVMVLWLLWLLHRPCTIMVRPCTMHRAPGLQSLKKARERALAGNKGVGPQDQGLLRNLPLTRLSRDARWRIKNRHVPKVVMVSTE